MRHVLSSFPWWLCFVGVMVGVAASSSSSSSSSPTSTCLQQREDFHNTHYELLQADVAAYHSFVESLVVTCGNSESHTYCTLTEDQWLADDYREKCMDLKGLFAQKTLDHLYCSSTWRKWDVIASFKVDNLGYCVPNTKECSSIFASTSSKNDATSGACDLLDCPYCRSGYSTKDCQAYLNDKTHYQPTLAIQTEGMLAAKTQMKTTSCWLAGESTYTQCRIDTHEALLSNSALLQASTELKKAAKEAFAECGDSEALACMVTDERFHTAMEDYQKECEDQSSTQWIATESKQMTCSSSSTDDGGGAAWKVESQFEFDFELGACIAQSEACNKDLEFSKASPNRCNDMVTSSLTTVLGMAVPNARPRDASFVCHVSANTLKDCPVTQESSSSSSSSSSSTTSNSSQNKKSHKLFWFMCFLLLAALLSNERIRLMIQYYCCRPNTYY